MKRWQDDLWREWKAVRGGEQSTSLLYYIKLFEAVRKFHWYDES